MNQNKEAGRMILADLQLFNQAAVLYENEVQPEILTSVTNVIKAWIDDQGWRGDIGDDSLDDSWLAPGRWGFTNAKNIDDAKVFFGLCRTSDDASYALADLCGVGSASFRFWFVVDDPLIKKPKKKFDLAWQSLLQNYNGKLKPLGFVLEGTSFYLPLRLDPDHLVAAWGDDNYEDLLAPMGTALDVLAQATPIFQQLLDELKQLDVISWD
jgi:hypothetical protein